MEVWMVFEGGFDAFDGGVFLSFSDNSGWC